MQWLTKKLDDDFKEWGRLEQLIKVNLRKLRYE